MTVNLKPDEMKGDMERRKTIARPSGTIGTMLILMLLFNGSVQCTEDKNCASEKSEELEKLLHTTSGNIWPTLELVCGDRRDCSEKYRICCKYNIPSISVEYKIMREAITSRLETLVLL